jgi:SAM-dependent methyltransferase
MPYFRGLLRAVEARFYEAIELPKPTLDVGCGDGHFASVAFSRKLEVGTDPWWDPLVEAEQRDAYQLIIQTDGAAQPFPDGYFSSAVSNSVLEHIPHLDEVLIETARVLRPGAPFIFCVPNHNFLNYLSISNVFEKVGLHSAANAYQNFFNWISRHYHCDDPETWENRLEKSGFCLKDWWHYFSQNALHTLEWGHYFGLPSLICKKLLDRWILVPKPWNLALTRRLVEPHYGEPLAQENGAYTFFIAQKI